MTKHLPNFYTKHSFLISRGAKETHHMNWDRGVRDKDSTHNTVFTIEEKDLIDDARKARILFGHKFETKISTELLDYMDICFL